MTAQAVSVADEVSELAHALDAARLLADCLVNEQLATEEDIAAALRQICAVLNVVAARLRLVGRVARGTAEVELLLEAFNESSNSDGELVLPLRMHVGTQE